MAASRAKLTEGDVRTHLVTMTVPMIWGILSIILFNAVDVFFIAKLGTEPLAAISFCYPVILTVAAMGIGLGVGTASVAARALGQGNSQKVCAIATNALVLSFLLVACLALVGLLTIRPLFTLLGAPAELMPAIESYMRIWYLGTPLLVIPMVGNSLIRAGGDTKTPSRIMMGAALINALVDPLLIFGLGPFPRLELEGAAYASILARLVAFSLAGLILIYRERLIDFRSLKPSVTLPAWREILRVGLPAALAQMLNPILNGVITAFVAGYGAVAVAGYGVAGRIEALCLTVVFALGSAVAPIVGQNWGADKMDRVRETTATAFTFCLLFGVTCVVLLPFLGPQVAKLFDPTPEVVSAAGLYLTLAPLGYAGLGIALVASSSFNGAGKPLWATAVAVLRAFVLVIPCALLGSWLGGLPGLFAGVGAGNLLAGGVTYLYFRQRCNVKIKLSDATRSGDLADQMH